ncbi:MAG: sigma-70 family RNA polymerase sigma factor [Pseudomonadota bacterium]
MHAVSDEQLIQWVANGDVSCLGTLFDRYQDGLLNYCWQLTHNQAVAEDLVQEVFLRLLRRAKSYRGEASFKTWVYQIARNVSYDHLRKQQRQQTDTNEPEIVNDAVVDERSAEQAAAGQESLGHLADSLASLTAEQREVIWLGRCEFSDYRSLATALGCTAQAARVRMHRAMKALNEVFNQLQGAKLDV